MKGWILIDLDRFWNACGAAVGGVAGAMAAAGEFAAQIFGVPLPVVVSSAAGAALARSFLPPVSFLLALLHTAVWTVIGCAGAPLAQATVPAIVSSVFNRDLTLPGNTLAALAAVVAAMPWWGPQVWPWVKAKFQKNGSAPNA